MQVDPKYLPALLQMMDTWLDLAPEQRTEWLADVERTQPGLLPALQELLREPSASFLDTLPPFDTSGVSGPLTPGTLAGPYRLERELGRGGMGVVWLATRADGAPDRRVALKFPLLYSYDRTLELRFARERDILARLEDARIARLYDAGVTLQGQPYLALEYVDGEPITAYCDRLRLDLRSRLKLFLQVLEAVQYAHSHLVIHRDLKPANILVTPAGQVRLLDFGIARLLQQGEADNGLTGAGGRVLTPDYASPEQLAGNAVTTATDIYSLGVLLHELLAGRRPSASAGGADPEAIASARGGLTARRLAASLRGDLETIVAKAIQADPRNRYATAEAFAEDVERYLRSQPVHARPESRWYRARKFVGRNRLAVSAALAILVAVAAGGTIAWRQKLRADREAAIAQAISDFLEKDLLSQAGPETQAGAGRTPDPDIKIHTALDRAAAQLPGRFARQPEVEAAIRQTIGSTYLDLGLYAPAEQQLSRALELRRHVLGTDHPETLRTMQVLTDTYQRAGKYDAAEALGQKLLDTEQRLGFTNTPEAIAVMVTLADIAGQGRADYPRAEMLDRQVLEIARRVRGESDSLTLATMNNLAAVLTRESKFAQAEDTYRQLIDRKQHVLGPDHPSTLATMNGLGVLYRNEGKYAEAETVLKPALEGRRRAMGEQHRDTLSSMNGLGLLYSIEGRYAEAEPLLAYAAETAGRVLGEDNPDAQSCRNNLAELYRRENRLKQSEAAYERLLTARRRTYGPDNPFTANTLGALGEVKLRLGKRAEADSLLGAADEHYRKHGVESWRRYYVECLLGEISSCRTLKAKAGSIPPEYREAAAQAQNNFEQMSGFGRRLR
jgi:eukaryotic-like serine/threonine-protein kinase